MGNNESIAVDDTGFTAERLRLVLSYLRSAVMRVACWERGQLARIDNTAILGRMPLYLLLRLLNMHGALREWETDAFAIKGFFHLFLHCKEHPPIVSAVGPHA